MDRMNNDDLGLAAVAHADPVAAPLFSHDRSDFPMETEPGQSFLVRRIADHTDRFAFGKGSEEPAEADFTPSLDRLTVERSSLPSRADALNHNSACFAPLFKYIAIRQFSGTVNPC